MRSPIWWFGGKGNLVSRLLPLVPGHRIYVEAFGGGASLLFAKAPSPVEVYNDIDRGLVDFFHVLRDPALFDEFHRLVSLTPYSRGEYLDCRATWREQADPVERARRWYTVARQSFAGKFGIGGWGRSIAESSRGMASICSGWLSIIEGLPQIHARLVRVQIECLDWQECLRAYDTPETFFYLDPPFIPETRRGGGYAHELATDDHRELVEVLLGLLGKVLLSGYAHPIYEPLENAGWGRVDWEVGCAAVGRTRAAGLQGEGAVREKQMRVESVWMNYPSPTSSSGGREYRQEALF